VADQIAQPGGRIVEVGDEVAILDEGTGWRCQQAEHRPCPAWRAQAVSGMARTWPHPAQIRGGS
jgi:hypothetical protein